MLDEELWKAINYFILFKLFQYARNPISLDVKHICDTMQNPKQILNILFKIFTCQRNSKPFLKAKPQVLYSATH